MSDLDSVRDDISDLERRVNSIEDGVRDEPPPKLNDKLSVHFTSDRKDWGTPWWLIRRCEEHIEASFTLDVCATADNAKCERFFSPEDDGLKQDWSGNCWCNPPYGRNIIDHWTRKAAIEVSRGARVVMLLPARTDTIWWHDDVVPSASTILFLKGRIHFVGAKNGAPFPSAIAILDGTRRGEPKVSFVEWKPPKIG